MANSTVIATFNEQGQVESLTQSQYNYDQRIAAMSTDDKTKYLAMTEKLDRNDMTTVTSYGRELSTVISKNGDNLLNSVRGDNSSVVVQLTNELLGQLNLIDIDEINTNTKWKRFWRSFPIVGKMMTSVETIMNKYDNIKEKVTKIGDKIEEARTVALRDNSTLNVIFEANVSYIDQIRELILAAKIREAAVAEELENMKAHANEFEIYEINDTHNFLTQIQKKIVDMETTEYVLTQNLLQIRATQQNNIAIADKSDNIVNNVLPLWKNQLSISIIMNNQKNSIEAQQKIADTTNKILRENAKALKMNSINVVRASEEAVIKLDTLNDTTQELIETINEVKNIHDKGAAERKEYESHLRDFARQLEISLTDSNRK